MEIIALATRCSRQRVSAIHPAPPSRWLRDRELHPQPLHVKPIPAWTMRRWFKAHQERPFKILGLQQVAIGGIDKKVLVYHCLTAKESIVFLPLDFGRVWYAILLGSGHLSNTTSDTESRASSQQTFAPALARLWSDALGVEKVGSYESKSENVREDILKLGHGVNAVEIDLMEPLDPEKAPRVQTPALNHIGLWVHPLPECVEWLTRQGMRFTPGGIRKGASGHDVAFIHPKGDANNPLCGEGVLIELVQAPRDVIAHAERK